MKSRRGFTLVELLLVLALISIIIVAGTNFFLIGVKSHAITIDEFNVQSKTRLVSSKINSVIRDASGVFVLYREDAEDLTEEWNYIMLSEDHTKLLEYAWDGTSSTHVVRELVTGINDVSFDLEFIKRNPSDVDKLLEFNLIVKTGGKERLINTELESINALQVIDRSYLNEGNTLSFRYDSRLDEASNAQAVISMVLDTSGSMAKTMNNNTAYDSYSNPYYHSRLKKMKAEAIRLVDELAKNTNIYISIIPFSSTANNPRAMLQASSNLSTIKSSINGFSANGGTNTGDGIRRGYYQIKDFNEDELNKNKTNKNFMIILVDGVTTFASVNKVNEVVSTPIDQGPQYNLDGHIYNRSNPQNNTITVRIDEGPIYSDGTYDYSKYVHRDWTSGEKYFSGPKRDAPFIDNNREYFYSSTWSGNHYYRYYEHLYRRYLYRYNGVKSDDYVTGDNNISNNEAQNNVDYRPNGRYAGDGSSLDPWGTEYVDIIGNMVKEYKEGTNESIQVYVIGFSARTADHASLEDIAMATRGDDIYYEAGDSAALEEIFKAIQRDITDALWHIGGPN
ncbi:vWA domain-containing protein [Sedimentibacter saalensis]|uniref:vWA domain-containing protein n=1 Tax=Sedimentibacter saalensis TaxID=130788 RepID=UPI0028A261E1|nr:VWA domain-containing protein [Sedimentibacter saalensis]